MVVLGLEAFAAAAGQGDYLGIFESGRIQVRLLSVCVVVALIRA